MYSLCPIMMISDDDDDDDDASRENKMDRAFPNFDANFLIN